MSEQSRNSPNNADALSSSLATLDPSSDYSRGVLDMLALLGLIRLEEDGRAVPADKVAAMVLDSLRAHLADNVVVGLRWDDLDAPAPRGVDILRAAEAARLAAAPEATPGRIAQAVVAVIKSRDGAGADRYLMQYDAHAGSFQPIGGKAEPGEDNAEVTLRREMAEELGLPAPPGPKLCALAPLESGWEVTRLSATYGILTRYTFTFFHALSMRFPLSIDQNTRWLTRAEIAAERAEDGRAISPIFQ